MDLCVIRPNMPAEMLRNYETPNDQQALREKVKKSAQFVDLPRGTTRVESAEATSIWELVDSVEG